MKLCASVLDCGDKSPLLTTRHIASFQGADVSAHSQMLNRTAIVTLLLGVISVCLFGYVLNFQSGVFHEFQIALLSAEWMLLVCIAVWCATFFFLTFSLNDLPLIGLLIAIAAFFVVSRPAMDAITILAGVTLGKGMRFALESGKRKAENPPSAGCGARSGEFRTPNFELQTFLVGLIMLLAFASWWHLDMTNNFYHGPRWMGLWNNPNDYGLLMGAGLVLTIGLLAENLKSEKLKAEMEKRKLFQILKAESRKQKLLVIFLLVAAGMMGVGLVFSYSRGAWVGTAIGLLYLTKQTKAESGKRKAKMIWYLLPIGLLIATVILVCWKTPDTAPWFVKRLDLSRGSVQHRMAAWKAGFEMMRDHPFGVGWNKTVETYEKHYLPPENSASAITTNDYLMLGTQIGIPALLCFLTYVWLCFRSPRSNGHSPQLSVHSPQSVDKSEIGNRKSEIDLDSGLWTLDSQLRVACRSAAIAMLVAFWFDGGLFKLATASVFWILLELGAERQKLKTETGRQIRHLTQPHPQPLSNPIREGVVGLSSDEAEREPKSEIGSQRTEADFKSAIGNRKSAIDWSLVPPSPGCGATSTSAAMQ